MLTSQFAACAQIVVSIIGCNNKNRFMGLVSKTLNDWEMLMQNFTGISSLHVFLRCSVSLQPLQIQGIGLYKVWDANPVKLLVVLHTPRPWGKCNGAVRVCEMMGNYDLLDLSSAYWNIAWLNCLEVFPVKYQANRQTEDNRHTLWHNKGIVVTYSAAAVTLKSLSFRSILITPLGWWSFPHIDSVDLKRMM